MAIRNILFGRYLRLIRNKLIRLRISVRNCLIFICCLPAIWIFYDAFLGDYSNHGLGDWVIRRPYDKQVCVHPQMPLYNPKIMLYLKKLPPVKCSETSDWVYTESGRVFITSDAVAQNGHILCEMTPIFMEDDDYVPTKGATVPIMNGSVLKHDAFTIKCKAENGKTYENLHAGITKHEVMPKTKSSNMKGMKGLNVIIWGADSLSSLMFQRLLPETHDYFINTLGGIHLEGYNIIGDGTAQAWIPILTGKTQFEQPDVQKGVKDAQFVDIYPFIWREYEKRGYVTHFAEDSPEFGMFQYKLKGFQKQPVHHYMRPFFIEADKYLSSPHLPFDERPSKYCLGSRPRPRLMLDWIKESFATYPNILKFFAFFTVELTHEYNNLAQLFEPFLLEFLEYMNSKSYLNNTVIILMSDHGARFQKLRATEQGKIEERMPYFAFRFPEWFRYTYPTEFNNFVRNSKLLTTPFDIHATLMDLIGMEPSRNNQTAGPGISLFREIPLERTCEHARIEPHYCACLNWEKTSAGDADVISAAHSVINIINNILKPFISECIPLTLSAIKEASKFSTNQNVLKFRKSPSGVGYGPDMSDTMQAQDTLFLVTFYTEPGMGLFEATTRKRTHDGKYLADLKQISRLNKYGNSSRCMLQKAPQILPYCVCRNTPT